MIKDSNLINNEPKQNDYLKSQILEEKYLAKEI